MTDLVYIEDGSIIEKSIGNDSIFDSSILGFYNYTVSNSQLIPGWWQHKRERFLQKAAIENDLLSMTLWNLQMLLQSLPFVVRPRNTMIDAHFRIAEYYDTIVRDSMNRISSKLILDMLIHDMGAYAVIESNSSWSKPLNDLPTELTFLPNNNIILNHNDSDVFPIIYIHKTKGNIKIHESRLINLTQLPFGIHDDSQVGLSFVSRAFNVAEVMRSVNTHALEQLGELESQRIIWGTDTTGKEIKRAFKESEREAVQTGKRRAAGNVYIGMRDSAAKIGMLDLKQLPAGFNWAGFTQTTLRLLAFAAGVDVNDLIATDTAGTTKSAVAISDLKSKQKLYTWYCNTLKQQIESKVLPRDLELVVGNANNDISESKARTFTSLSRANKFSIDSGTIDERTSREIQLNHGMLSQEQVFFMELDDGRLPDGLPVSAVFFKKEQGLQKFLILTGFDEPWLIDKHEPNEIIPTIQRKVFELQGEVINSQTKTRHKNARIALAAYTDLLSQYENAQFQEQITQENIIDDNDIDDNNIDDNNIEGVEPEEEIKKNRLRHLNSRNSKKKEIFAKTTKVGRANNSRLKKEIRKSFTNKELDIDSLRNELETILIEWNVHDDILQDVLEDFINIAESLRFNEIIQEKKLTNVLDTYEEIMNQLEF